MNPDGSERVQLSSFAGGIDGFKFSPDESKVLFISQVKYGERTVDKYPDLDKASGMVIDDLMYKHWMSGYRPYRIRSWLRLPETR